MKKCYLISQNRNRLNFANIPNEIKEQLLSAFEDGYYKVLAIISKIFDENENIDSLGIIISFIDNEIVIRGSILYSNSYDLLLLNLKDIFEKNGFKYLEIG